MSFLKLTAFLFTILLFPSFLNSQTWVPIGSGFSGFVTCVTVYNGELVAGGNFTSAGFTSANRIAKWNGSSWSALGSGVSGTANIWVQTLELFNGNLWVGGNFTIAGGLPSYYVCRWTGSTWLPFNLGTNAGVYDFQIFNGEIVMCGNYTYVDGLLTNYICKWNGNSWSTLGSGMNQAGVYALTIYNNELIAAGNFATAGGVPANNIAKWNGSSWSALGSGTNNYILALGVFNGQLYAGGEFTIAGGVSASRIARWNGSSWAPLGGGVNGQPLVFYVRNSELVVGGAFNNVGNYIARWDGFNWYSLPSGGMNSFVRALGTYGTSFVAGGSFTSAGGTPALFIARTDDPLPVVLSEFGSNVIKNNVKLYWSTTEEINNKGFDIERKTINGNWQKVGYVEGNGTTYQPQSYNFYDSYLQKGIYRYRLKQVDYSGTYEYYDLTNDVNIGNPEGFFVSQNYPNPSNPGSRINYQIPENGKVTIRIYDAAGRQLGILVDEVKEAGYYTLEFDGRNLASGVYYYKVVTGNYSATKKMILIK